MDRTDNQCRVGRVDHMHGHPGTWVGAWIADSGSLGEALGSRVAVVSVSDDQRATGSERSEFLCTSTSHRPEAVLVAVHCYRPERWFVTNDRLECLSQRTVPSPDRVDRAGVRLDGFELTEAALDEFRSRPLVREQSCTRDRIERGDEKDTEPFEANSFECETVGIDVAGWLGIALEHSLGTPDPVPAGSLRELLAISIRNLEMQTMIRMPGSQGSSKLRARHIVGRAEYGCQVTDPLRGVADSTERPERKHPCCRPVVRAVRMRSRCHESTGRELRSAVPATR